MFGECLSVGDDFDWYYEDVEKHPQWVSADDQKCDECGDVIGAGLPHDKYVGVRPKHLDPDDRPGQVDVHRTCEGCMAIWKDLAGGDRALGQLNDLVFEAYGTPLSSLPFDDDHEEYEELINQHPELDMDKVRGFVQPEGASNILQMIAGLELLEPFLSDEQLLTTFRWAHGFEANPGEDFRSMQDRIEWLSRRLCRTERSLVKAQADLGDFAHLMRERADVLKATLAGSPDRAAGGYDELVDAANRSERVLREASDFAIEDRWPTTNRRKQLAEIDEEIVVFDDLDSAIIGTIHRCGQPILAAYSYTACIDAFVADGLTPEEAAEHMSFNVEGAWVGERTPCVIHPLEE